MGLDIIICVFLFILGSAFASFFGVVCYRIPNDLSISNPPSRCDNCNHKLSWYENIPILSYIFLGGKCKNCKSKIPVKGFIFEIIGGILLVLGYFKYKLDIQTILVELILLVLLLMAMYDIETNTVLDIVWIIYLVLVISLKAYQIFVLKADYLDTLLGGLICGGFFVLVKLIFYLIKKVDALGNGDIIVMAISGLLFGVKPILISILVASVIGSIIELTLIGLKKTSPDRLIPFLPYLVLGIVVAFLYGNEIVNIVIGVI